MSEKRSNRTFFLGIVVAVLLPLFFYEVTNVLSKNKVKMPGYYHIDKITVSADGKAGNDTLYHKVNDSITLTNQFGQPVALNKELQGKIVVVDFIFTNCASSCPRLTRSMKLLQTSFRKDPKKEARLDTIIRFVTITINPERDSFQVMRAYADKYGADPDNWWFLTGDKRAIYNFARNELGVATGPGDGGAEDFIHSEQLVLIDKDRYIRGYYSGLNDTDVRHCADDIVLLNIEWKHRK